MTKPGHLRRLLILAILMGLTFAGLGARLVVLQVVQHDKYRAVAERKNVFLNEPRRGDILDIQGNPLAISVPVKRVFANPRFIGPYSAEIGRALAPLLSYGDAELTQRLKPTVVRTNERGRLITNSYVNLKRKVSAEEWQQITQVMARLTLPMNEAKLSPAQKRFFRVLRNQAIYAEDDQKRSYTSGSLAAHVLGYAQDEERQFNNVSVFEITGKDGIEAWLDKQLRGMRGWRVAETDHRQREIAVFREQEVESRPGLNVVVTLDMYIQNIVEAALADAIRKYSPISASAMVVRPRTGEILAMATLPTYDPNKPGDAKPEERRNRIITDFFEPGSTFKIVAISAALNENLVKLTDPINCEGGLWYYRNKPLHDSGSGHDILTVEEVVAKSSNIGTAKVGLMLGQQRLYDYIKAFGFGDKTGITLGGEVLGLVHPVKQWDGQKITRVPMGQGIAVTHLQIMMAMCAIANDGKLMRPMLVNRLEEANGQIFAQYYPQVLRQAISERAAKQTVAALKTAATDGTAAKAQLDHYTVAGKTGTAEKPPYHLKRYYASFIGFFPADAPELCISVMLDDPPREKGYYGGQTAAPVFKVIAEQAAQYLKIRPDREENSGDTVAGTAVQARLSAGKTRGP